MAGRIASVDHPRENGQQQYARHDLESDGAARQTSGALPVKGFLPRLNFATSLRIA